MQGEIASIKVLLRSITIKVLTGKKNKCSHSEIVLYVILIKFKDMTQSI